MALTIHRGNSLTSLADALAGVQRSNPLPPLAAEPIIVQSLGMKRWLSFALAERLGVAANIAFHFPGGFVSQLFAAVLPDSKPSAVFDREVLPWRVLAVLPSLLTRPEFAQLAAYVEGESRELKTFQLAGQIARVMDRYIAYRPQMILDWQRGVGSDWQPILWREIARDEVHAPMLAERFCSRIATCTDKLPQRFSIFGAASLGPFFLNALTEAARHTEAHLFLLTPTPEYWGDIVSNKTIARIHRKSPAAAAHREQGHPLLASFGKVGRDFFDAVAGITNAQERDYFAPPADSSALACIQRDIYELRDRTSHEAEKHSFTPADKSIQLHAAHSPLREVEILHDQMLAWFESGITPRDVLVMMPDVEAYAPFIEAVFSTPESERMRIPFSIADRAASRENVVAQAFISILALAGSRLTAPEVLALLELTPVRARFDITENDLPLIRDWVVRAGIRWGKDAAHRGLCNVPAFAENSWRSGMDRLLLGFALPGDGKTLFEGILPEPVAEGSAAKTLGAFAHFVTTLFSQLASLETPRSASEWTFSLRTLLDTFISADDSFTDERSEVATHLDAIAANVAQAIPYPELATGLPALSELSLQIIRAHVNTLLANTDRAGTGFLSGRVTFCSMKPMRSIPHRVIALLGLDGDKFPRRDTAPKFDLVAAEPKPGDRSTRDDDRQIFIEAILASRDVLHLSHVGLSAKDNAPLPPSTLVAELLAHLDAAFTTHDETLPSQLVIHTHPLQAFSQQAFVTPLFSFSSENARACAATRVVRHARGPLFSEPLPEPEIARELSLDRLTQCLAHPVKFFARVQNIRLPGEEMEAADTEPLELDTLTAYNLRNDLAAASLAGTATRTIEHSLRASGALPPAYPGFDTFSIAEVRARTFAKRVAAFTPGTALPPTPIEFTVDEWRVNGTLTSAYSGGLIFARPAKLKARDLLRAWLTHLALCASAPASIAPSTLIITEDSGHQFRNVTEATVHLREILRFFRAAHCEPLRFCPECSLAYAKADDRPLASAAEKWSGDSDYIRYENADDWNAFFFGHEESPLDESFEQWAGAIFDPLLEHLTDIE